MAKICFDDVIKHVHGSLTGKSSVVFKHYSPSNINYSAARPERTRPMTAAQLLQQDKFKRAQAAVVTIMADPEQLADYERQFKKQKKYVLLRSFIMSRIWNTL